MYRGRFMSHLILEFFAHVETESFIVRARDITCRTVFPSNKSVTRTAFFTALQDDEDEEPQPATQRRKKRAAGKRSIQKAS